MKKQLIFLCALAVAATACNVKESWQSNGFCTARNVKEREQSNGLRSVTLTATNDSPADSKTGYTDEGIFSWTANDQIAVYTDAEQFYPLFLTDGTGTNTATFTGEIEGTPSGYAVYPYLVDNPPTYIGDVLSVYLPNSYDWSSDSYTEANNPMVGIANGDETIYFKSLAGLLKITLLQVDSSATKVLFYSGKQLTGSFDVQDLDTATPYITAEEDRDDDPVTFNFSELTEDSNMVFYLPIPVGTYYFGFDVQDKDGNSLWKYTDIYTTTVARNELMIMDPFHRYTIYF